LVFGEKLCFMNITNNTHLNVKYDELLQYQFYLKKNLCSNKELIAIKVPNKFCVLLGKKGKLGAVQYKVMGYQKNMR